MTFDAKKVLKMVSLLVFVLFIIIFAFFRSKDLIFGVKIKNVTVNDTPIETIGRITADTTTIKGNAKNATHLSLNGRIISVDQKGDFSETVALYSGYNIIELKALDRFGNDDKKIYKLMLDKQ